MMNTGDTQKSMSAGKKPISASPEGGFINKSIIIALVVFAVLGYGAYKYFGPKAPPRAELLKAANAFMSQAIAVSELVESTAEFKEAKSAFSAGGTMTTREFNYMARQMTNTPESRTGNLQQTLVPYKETFEAEIKKVNDSVKALPKQYTGKDKRAGVMITAHLDTLYRDCSSFIGTALSPGQGTPIVEYLVSYNKEKNEFRKQYVYIVTELKKWDVSERSSLKEAWDKELRIAEENLSKF